MNITIYSLFPDMFPGPLGESVIGKALEQGLWHLKTVNIRDFATDKHNTVDDTPFGGGAGMVMRADILDHALSQHYPDKYAKIRQIDGLNKQKTIKNNENKENSLEECPPLIYLTPRGRQMNQQMLVDLSKRQDLHLICGRYEGVDQRLLDKWQVEEVSLGDFVLSGGEIAALALIDGVVRLIQGVLGSANSLDDESFTGGLLEYPHYTKPSQWQGFGVPEVLTSGHHGKIKEWRLAMAEEITRHRRPDLWQSYIKTNNKN